MPPDPSALLVLLATLAGTTVATAHATQRHATLVLALAHAASAAATLVVALVWVAGMGSPSSMLLLALGALGAATVVQCPVVLCRARQCAVPRTLAYADNGSLGCAYACLFVCAVFP
jgi:hypothetical protein